MEEIPDSLPTNSDPLIGDLIDKFAGNKLPSNRDVLSVLLHRRLAHGNREHFKESAKIISTELQHFWNKSTIPALTDSGIQKKIEKLHAEYRSVFKNIKRHNDSQRQKEAKFREKCDNLFEIAKPTAEQPENEVQIEEKRKKRKEQEKRRLEKLMREQEENGNW